MIITLKDLPKISLNQWYSGNHWSKRKEIKDLYRLIIKNQFKSILSKDNYYQVYYDFRFKNKPLDASNCAAMVKLIEDIIFENDNYKTIHFVGISSSKDIEDKVIVKIVES